MTLVHCNYKDCENNENGMCHAAAVRISDQDCCLTYHPYQNESDKVENDQGDKLLWDKEYFEDDPLDDDFIL
jgi:hypothetical protein